MADKLSKVELLGRMQELGTPVGAIYLSQNMGIPQASIGRVLREAEAEGLLRPVGNKGRLLTEAGLLYLQEQKNVELKKHTASRLVDYVAHTSPEKLLEILETRKLLEAYTVRLASVNITEENGEQLDAIMREYIAEIRCGGLGHEQDLQIHLLLANMAGNMTVYQVLKLILTRDNTYKLLVSVDSAERQNQMFQHSEIIQKVKEHNADAAVAAMQTHLDSVIENAKLLFGGR